MNTTTYPGRRTAAVGSWRRACAVAAVIALCSLLPAPAAHAAVGSVTCVGSSHVTYAPGLTLTPQNVTVTETDTVPSCTSTDPTLTSVITGGPFSYPAPGAACNDIELNPAGGTLTIYWNNGQTSTLTGLVGTLTATGGIVQNTATGTVTAGEFTGASATITWIYALVNPLLCLTTGGLTTQDGTILLQITGV
ncbi:hypothetical protein [Actinokineospora diospyrosa]|uniref:Ig-like domain-containing protein n=1 Tax=Actinokineospora diospyrosa TaxID=103728 RepID=A0ABT1IBU6_9PSEU|nr:hypothetical protein [Actinokineospora diospyrosa]MCP2270104.1 hypothetical protein [Actinokineospora diospyrosa]